MHKTKPIQNLKLSRVITGMWQIADMQREGRSIDEKSAIADMIQLAEAGMTSFDMADHYGDAEILAGRFLKQYTSPDHIQLLTKWVPSPDQTSYEDVRNAVRRALDRMQTDQITLLQYHTWRYEDPIWLEHLFWLNELREEGLIAHLGVTNFNAAHLRMVCASGIPIATNQVSFSLIDQRASQDMLQVCNEFGVKLLAYGTMAGSWLHEKWIGQPDPGIHEQMTWSQMKYKRFIDAAGGWHVFQDTLKLLQVKAKRHSISLPQLASAAILHHPHVASVIVGTRLGELHHIEKNRQIPEIKLTTEDIAEINKIISHLTPIPGDCGDEYRQPPYLTASGDLSHHIADPPLPYAPSTRQDGSIQVFSGTPWEGMAGYCRAIKKGNHIWVSGTTATHGHRMIGGTDAAAQTHFIIDKIAGALASLGAGLEHVTRTRIFVNNIEDWEPVARAHGNRFAAIQPANTLVEAKLVGSGYLVEIEAEAIIE